MSFFLCDRSALGAIRVTYGATPESRRMGRVAFAPAAQGNRQFGMLARSGNRELSREVADYLRACSDARPGKGFDVSAGRSAVEAASNRNADSETIRGRQSMMAQVSEGWSPEGRLPGEQAPEGRASEGRPLEGQAPEGSASEGSAPEGQAPEGSASEGSAPEGQALHIVVPSRRCRVGLRGVVSHVWSSRLPPRSFVELGNDAYAAVPELVYAIKAGRMSISQAAFTASMLCASFRFEGDGWTGPEGQGGVLPALEEAPALTSVESLQKYIASMPEGYGMEKAQRALRWAVDGAASPQEIKMALLLSLPPRLGGYGLPVPLLNVEIPVPAESRRLTPLRSFKPDLFWPESGTMVEYNGHEWHDGAADRDRDDQRRNLLGHLGYKVVVVTSRELRSEFLFDGIARQVMKGVSKRNRASLPKHRHARLQLRAELGIG